MKVCLLLLPSLIAGLPFSETSNAGVDDDGENFAVAYADIDADGDVDMFVTNSGSANQLYINDGTGHFEERTAASGIDPASGRASRGAVFADVNGDGNLDLYVTDSSNPNALYLGDGQGHFKEDTVAGVEDKGFGQGACVADVNGDGHLDLFVANFGQSNSLYINKGNGLFDNATLGSGLESDGVQSFGCAFGDIDEDGDLDLYVTNAGSYNKLYANSGNGVFTDITDEAGVAADEGQGRGVSFADLNGDGHLDLYMVAPVAKNYLFLGDGTGKFADKSDASGTGDHGTAQGMNVADVDGDGDLDIFVSNIMESCSLYINKGNGEDGTPHFEDYAASAGVNYHRFGQGVAFGDLNGDGALDMYLAVWGIFPYYKSALLMNEGAAYHYLKVRPVTDSGRATLLGTEVRLFEAGTRKPVGVRMQVDGGSGFASQNAYDVYFGLNEAVASGVQQFDVEVRCGGAWSSAATGVAANQVVNVKCSKAQASVMV